MDVPTGQHLANPEVGLLKMAYRTTPSGQRAPSVLWVHKMKNKKRSSTHFGKEAKS